MRKIQLSFLAVSLVFIAACSKKSHPSKQASVIYKNENPVNKPEVSDAGEEANKPAVVVPAKKPLPPGVEKKLFPETIYVNDAAAKKSVDGRLYYDVEGHRYWKNYKDGKYYLFNKSMYKNPDFKPPVKDSK